MPVKRNEGSVSRESPRRLTEGLQFQGVSRETYIPNYTSFNQSLAFLLISRLKNQYVKIEQDGEGSLDSRNLSIWPFD